eukprot:scaffold16861_cov101-Isochrysis_galbana.AAC.3
MRCSTPLIWMPSISGAVSIMRVSASTTTRKARGEKGHPCGTPHLILNGLLYWPAILTRRVGGRSGLASIVAQLAKLGPKPRAPMAW